MPYKHKKKRKCISFVDELDARDRRRRGRSPSSSNSSTTDSDESDCGDDLKPIGFYIKNRSEMVRQMFHAVPARHLNAILPDVLKDVSISELQKLCIEQVEVMSKKRIRYTLACKEMTSSSGTEDSTSAEEDEIKDQFAQGSPGKVPSVQSETSNVQQPDSTSADQIISDLLSENVKSNVLDTERIMIDPGFELNALTTNYELDFVEIDQGSATDSRRSPVLSTASVETHIHKQEAEIVPSVLNNSPNAVVDVNPESASISAAESPPADLTESAPQDSTSTTLQTVQTPGDEMPCSVVQSSIGVQNTVESSTIAAVDSEVDDDPSYDENRNNLEEEESPLDYSEDESDVPEKEPTIVQESIVLYGVKNMDMCNIRTENIVSVDQNSQSPAIADNDLEEGEIEEVASLISNPNALEYIDAEKIGQTKAEEHDKDAEISRIKSTTSESSSSKKVVSCSRCPDDDSILDDSYRRRKCSDNPSSSTKFEPLIVKEGEEMECYDTDSDYEGHCSDEDVYPPGMEPTKVTPEKFTQENKESIDNKPCSLVKKCSLVPIKTLYKQLKEEKERKKKQPRPKIYGAKEPVWTRIDGEEKKKFKISNKDATGPSVPKKSDLMLPDVMANDESNRRLYNELIESDENQIKKPKKKSNILLTDEFLADLDRQKIEHDMEMERKAKLLRELKNQRQKILEYEKKVEKDIKKQFDLGIIGDDDSLRVTARKSISLSNGSDRLPLADIRSQAACDSMAEDPDLPGVSGCSPHTFSAAKLKSFSVCLGEKGREVVVNEKADCMRRAFTIEASSSEEEGEIEHSNPMHAYPQRDITKRESRDELRQSKISHSNSRSPRNLDFRKSPYDDDHNSRHNSRCIPKYEEHHPTSKEKARSMSRNDYLENVSSSNEDDSDSELQSSKTRKKQYLHVERVGKVIKAKKSDSLPAKPTSQAEVSQKLELYELEMRAMAIKALMKSKNM